MNKIQMLILFPCLSICLMNCGKRTSSEIGSILEVNIDGIEDQVVKLSDLVETYDMVLLDNKNEALLNRPVSYAVSNGYILIIDMDQHPAKLFTRNGQYIRDIGEIGIGPDEYLSVVSPFIDEITNSFWLLLGGNYENQRDGWYYVFNSDGAIVHKINTGIRETDPYNSNAVLVFNDQILIPGNIKSENMLVCRSLKDDKIIKVPNRINPDYFTYRTNISTIYPFRDRFIFKIGEADTIYSFVPDSGLVKPLASIFTDKHKFDEIKIRDARSSTGPGRFANILAAAEDCCSIHLEGETNKYYILSVSIEGSKPQTKLLLVNKKTGEAVFGQIINDFQGGLTLNDIPYFYMNKYMVFHSPAIKMLNDIDKRILEISDEKVLEKLRNISEKLTVHDNDILLICKLK
jgi:hypothetical protein